MRKFLFAICTLSTILIVSCKNSSNKSNSGTEEDDLAVSEVVEEASEDDDIMTLGSTYVTSVSSKATDLMEGKVNLTMELTIYGDGSAEGKLIETNDASSYLNDNSYTHKVEGSWEEVSKHNKRFLKITLVLEDSSQDYYKEFVYYVDEDLNAYADNINTRPIKLIEKSPSLSNSGSAISRIFKDNTSVKAFEYSSLVNAGNEYKIIGAYYICYHTDYSIYTFNRRWILFRELDGSIVSLQQEDNYSDTTRSYNDITRFTNALKEMKELFIKNDKIAKENNVTTDITKDVSDKFSFMLYEDAFGYRGYKTVLYKYIGGISSMEITPENATENPKAQIWKFYTAQDFDTFINALDYTKLYDAVEKHRLYLQKQKEAEDLAKEKEEAESALFD